MKMLGILKHQTFNLPHRFFNVSLFIPTTIFPIFYIACYQLAFLFISFVFQFAVILFFSVCLCAQGWKALWQNLVGALARCVLTMCLTAKGRYVVPYPNYSYTAFKILCHCFALFIEYTIRIKINNRIPLVIT
jgi:hypothetical protein